MKSFTVFRLLTTVIGSWNISQAFLSPKVSTTSYQKKSNYFVHNHNIFVNTAIVSIKSPTPITFTSLSLSKSSTDDSQGSLLKDKASVVMNAFEALNEEDKYDTVLTGLCSKILDSQSSSTDADAGTDTSAESSMVDDATLTPSQLAYKKLYDPIQLVEEMNQRGVKASPRSLMALIDATATTNDPRAMATVLSLSIKNGSLAFYGALQSTITPFPSSSTTTRSQRLQSLPDVPTDERTKEMTAAITTMFIASTCFLLQGVGNLFNDGSGNFSLLVDDIAPSCGFILNSMILIGVLDNFLDVFKSIAKVISITSNDDKQQQGYSNPFEKTKAVDDFTLPLGLGTGKLTGTIVKGFTRLLSVDTERECQCEAAAFFAAYSLGLPCFSFRPNALEGAVLFFESGRKKNDDDDDGTNNYDWDSNALDSLVSDSGILKMLIWLMAPVAMESSLHPQLITSDPRESYGFLQRLREKAKVFDVEDVLDNLLSKNNEKEIQDLLKWSYHEADILLRANRESVNDLTERLLSGASTVGDCVAALEEW